MLLAAKVNNAPDALRLLYRIEGVELPGGISTSRVVFLPPRGVALLQHPAMPKARTMRPADMRAWLAVQLATGPRSSAQLKTALEGAGFSWNSSKPTLYRVAASLHIRRLPAPGERQKLWGLP